MKFILGFALFIICLGNVNSINTKIYSKGIASNNQLVEFLASGNPLLERSLIEEFVQIYIEEAEIEGINVDIAFTQMCLETGFLKFGGLVEPYQNNFCGLGAFNDIKGAVFETPRAGVRAHIQHLKAYGTEDDLVQELIDPRFKYVKRGSVPIVDGLAGTWAEDPYYGKKITNLIKKLLETMDDETDIFLLAKNGDNFLEVNLDYIDSVDEVDNSKAPKGWD